jgi:hypothetical protein
VKTAKLSPFLIMTGQKGWRRHPEIFALQILFCIRSCGDDYDDDDRR